MAGDWSWIPYVFDSSGDLLWSFDNRGALRSVGGDEELFVAGGLAGLIVCKLPELPRLARKILPQLLPPYNMFELALSSETIFYASSSAVLEAYEALCFPRFKVSAGTPYAFFSAEIKPPFPVKLMLLSPFEFEKLRGGEDIGPELT